MLDFDDFCLGVPIRTLLKTQAIWPPLAAKALSHKPLKTGAGEGIRTLDPNLGKIRLDEISILNQLFIKLLKNPNTIRTFLKVVRLECFVLNVLVAALRPVSVIISANCNT